MTHRIASLLDSPSSPLARDALDIWRSGVHAVMPQQLFQSKIRQERSLLLIDDQCAVDLSRTRRLIVVGAGKASALMAAALHQQIFQHWPESGFPKIDGWINVPEGTFQGQLPGIQIHVARPAGVNLPTRAAVEGTQKILHMLSTAGKDDVVVCLLSGGGSALLVAPQDGVDLSDKQAVARCVAAAGGNIGQLNAVRSCLSRVKGGGLARACTAGRLVSLIISDVLGDPLETIASGPTFLGSSSPNQDRAFEPGDLIESGQAARQQALSILRELGLTDHPELRSVVTWLKESKQLATTRNFVSRVENVILGNNADAVDAAGVRAVELGYRYVMQSARQSEGDVQGVAQQAVRAIQQLDEQLELDCWISGGEPTVSLPFDGSGIGGRNQQLSLCVLEQLLSKGWPIRQQESELVFLSGGTDGEDGPTDAAGAYFDWTTIQRMIDLKCDPTEYRTRADAYRFFSKVGGLIKTGPTGTNVCDLRIALQSSPLRSQKLSQ